VIPLQSKYVHGLHCENNLQILSKTKNLKKNNYFNTHRSLNLKNFKYKKVKYIIFYHANDNLYAKFKYKYNFLNEKIKYFNIIKHKNSNIRCVPTIYIYYRKLFFFTKVKKHEGIIFD